MRRLFLLDLLKDPPYDDFIEIQSTSYKGIDRWDAGKYGEKRSRTQLAQRGATLALRGDDALKPVERAPTVPGPIEANVVHVFPHWRIRSVDGSDNHDYYLLPERRVPTQPRPVDAYRKGDGKPASLSPIELILPAPPPTPPPGWRPSVSLQAQWPTTFDTAIQNLDQINVKVSKVEPTKLYDRFRPASQSGIAQKSLPRVRVDDPKANAGWHHITTSLSNFWFEIDLQKISKPFVDNFDEDVYEFEVEMWSGTPPSSSTGTPPSSTSVHEPLLDAFRIWRAAASGDAGKPPAIDGLDDLFRKWFVAPDAGTPYFGHALVDKSNSAAPAPAAAAPPVARKAAIRRVFRVSRVGNTGWQIKEQGPQPRLRLAA